MSKQPLKRIYFDTNILFRWPNLPNNVAFLFGVANWVGADLYIPKTVEDELEGQFVRGANAAASIPIYLATDSLCRSSHIASILPGT